jgi:DNA-binding phage protein
VARRSADPPPRTWLRSGEFATGRLTAAAPAAASAAQSVARSLSAALEASELTRREVAERAGVSRSALYALLAGEVYPDFATVARLGDALGVSLWPDRSGGP